MTVKELCDLLGPTENGDLQVIVRVRRSGEDPEILEIASVIMTLERDTAEDIIELECDAP